MILCKPLIATFFILVTCYYFIDRNDNNTGSVKIMLKANNFTITSEKKRSILLALLTAAVSFVATAGRIIGYPSPVNVVVAVASGGNILSAFLGAAAGYAVFGGIGSGIIQLCTILVIAGIRMAFLQDDRRDDPVFMSMLTAGLMIMFGCVVSVAVPADTYTASMRMITALIAGCLVFIICTLRRQSRGGELDFSGVNGVFTAILYIMTVATLSALELPLINPGRIFGVFVLLAAAGRYRTAGGAVAGALTTCGVLLCSPQLASNTLLLATSGLICGAFVQFGVIASAIVFLGISLVSLVAIGLNGDTFHMFADLVAGAALFTACPNTLLKKASAFISAARSPADMVGQTASSRLNFASKTLGEIRGQINLVSAAIDRKTENRDLKVRLCAGGCSDCEMFAVCWKKRTADTKEAFEYLENTLVSYGELSAEDVRRCAPACCRPGAFAQSANEVYRRMLDERAENIKIAEMREMLTEQLTSMEDILSDLSYRVGQVREVDTLMSARMRDYFSRLGYPNSKACVYTDESNSRRAEIYLTSSFRGDLVRLTVGMSDITETDYDIPVITETGGITRLAFTELPDYQAEVSFFQACSEDDGYSGDTVESLDISPSEKYVIISDGMGTGKRAKLDSMFAVSLACRLLKAGLSMQSAYRLINSILRVKGWEESFATLDLLRLDLCGGSGEFLKAGASPAYLIRDGAVKAIGGQAFPAGILRAFSPDITGCKLFSGDMLIMSSDGVSESVIRQTPALIKSGLTTPQQLSQSLGEAAMKKAENGRRDDISIAVIKISSR